MPIAYLSVDDADATIAFYIKALGAEVVEHHKTDDGLTLHAELRLPGSGGNFMLASAKLEPGDGRSPLKLGNSPVNLLLVFDAVDAAWNQAVAQGAHVIVPLADQFWGARAGQFTDPAGHRWTFTSPQKD